MAPSEIKKMGSEIQIQQFLANFSGTQMTLSGEGLESGEINLGSGLSGQKWPQILAQVTFTTPPHHHYQAPMHKPMHGPACQSTKSPFNPT